MSQTFYSLNIINLYFQYIQMPFQKKVGPLVAVKCSRPSFSIILDRTRPDVLQSYGKSNPEREQIILIQLLQKKLAKNFSPFLRQELAKDRFLSKRL